MEPLIRLLDAASYAPTILVVLTAVAGTLVLADVLGGWLVPDDYDRPPMSPLADMRPDPDELDVHAHMASLDYFQRKLAASYHPSTVRVPDPTPVDDTGRVWKRGVHFDGGAA